MPYYYSWFDPTYILVLIGAAICMIASARVNSTFNKYSKYRSMSGMTGAQAAERILQSAGIYDVTVQHVSGRLTDHYDPRSKTIRLSQEVYDVATPAAVGVAAHEAGHAVQYAQNYLPIRIRAAIIPATNFGSRLSMPLILLGLLLPSLRIFAPYTQFFNLIAWIGVACYSLCVLFQLVTLPTEFNASSRALAAIRETSLLDEEETQASKKVLSAAAMTYVAAVGVALMSLLRLLMILGRRRD